MLPVTLKSFSPYSLSVIDASPPSLQPWDAEKHWHCWALGSDVLYEDIDDDCGDGDHIVVIIIMTKSGAGRPTALWRSHLSVSSKIFLGSLIHTVYNFPKSAFYVL
jgi:hypothetical protein